MGAGGVETVLDGDMCMDRRTVQKDRADGHLATRCGAGEGSLPAKKKVRKKAR